MSQLQDRSASPRPATVHLGRAPTSIGDIVAIAEGAPVALDPGALAGMRSTCTLLADALHRGQAIYGLTTGVGDLHSVRLTSEEQIGRAHV